jgi:hypothetical protein
MWRCVGVPPLPLESQKERKREIDDWGGAQLGHIERPGPPEFWGVREGNLLSCKIVTNSKNVKTGRFKILAEIFARNTRVQEGLL